MLDNKTVLYVAMSLAVGVPVWARASNLSGVDNESAATVNPIADLRQHNLSLPLDCSSPDQWKDSFYSMRGSRMHEAADMLAPRDTPVHAVEDGVIARMSWNAKGGNTIYQKDPTGTYSYYYAHLQRYQDGIKAGDFVRRGQVIGYVGTTGNAPANCPHLHFSIERCTTPESLSGIPLNPYEVFANIPFAPDRKAFIRGLALQGSSSHPPSYSPHPPSAVASHPASAVHFPQQSAKAVDNLWRSSGMQAGVIARSPALREFSNGFNEYDRQAHDIGLSTPRTSIRHWLGQRTKKWLRLGL